MRLHNVISANTSTNQLQSEDNFIICKKIFYLTTHMHISNSLFSFSTINISSQNGNDLQQILQLRLKTVLKKELVNHKNSTIIHSLPIQDFIIQKSILSNYESYFQLVNQSHISAFRFPGKTRSGVAKQAKVGVE